MGDEPLGRHRTAASAAMGAPSKYLVRTRSACVLARLPYAAIAKDSPLYLELRELVLDALAAPSSLMAHLQQPTRSTDIARLTTASSTSTRYTGMVR